MVSSSLREVVVHDDNPAYYQNQKDESIVIDKQYYEYIDEFCINKPESVAVVKETVDYISSGIQTCLPAVSNTAEEDKHTSPEKAGVLCVIPESESKVRII